MWPWRRTAARERADPPQPIASQRREWADLPPLQRTIENHPLVDPPGRFARSLASWRNPAFLGPLGHVVTPDEPSGLVEDIAVARSAEPTSPMPVVAKVPRGRGPATRLAAMVQRWGGEPEAEPLLDEPTRPAVEEAEAESGPVPETPSSPAVPSVAAAASPPALRLLPSIEPPSQALPWSGDAADGPVPAPGPGSGAVDEPPPSVQSAPPSPPRGTPELTLRAPPDHPSVTSAEPPRPHVQRTLLGEAVASRRPGLGAPIVPPTATPARETGPVSAARRAVPSVSKPRSVQRIDIDASILEPPGEPTAGIQLPIGSGPADPPVIDGPVGDAVPAEVSLPVVGSPSVESPDVVAPTVGVEAVAAGPATVAAGAIPPPPVTHPAPARAGGPPTSVPGPALLSVSRMTRGPDPASAPAAAPPTRFPARAVDVPERVIPTVPVEPEPLPVSRAMHEPAASAAASTSSAGPAAQRSAHSAASPPAVVVARLLADRPLRQRLPSGHTPDSPTVADNGAAVVESVRAASPAAPASVAVQRVRVGTADAGARRTPIPIPSWTPTTSALPVPSVPATPDLPAVPYPPGDSASLATFEPPLATAPHPPGMPAGAAPLAMPSSPATAGPSTSDPATGGWIHGETTPAGVPPDYQPATDTSAVGEPLPAAPSAGTPAPTATVSASSGSATAEPEDLLKKLFDPLYRQLRAELRKDRDRRGLITDLQR